MKDWIEKTINPPGMYRKNRGSLFSLTGKVFETVKNDALKAFNAHFPYLADPQKLKAHAKSLFIPHFDYDTEEEFRERVAAASFFLARAGERGYIVDQLQRHFGDRCTVSDAFLQVYVKIYDLGEPERIWARAFLDELLDPNINLNIAELFDLHETALVSETMQDITIMPDYTDQLGIPLQYNGAIKYDGKTVNKKIWIKSRYDGTFKYDGSVQYSGYREIPNPYSIKPPFKYSGDHIDDSLTMSVVIDREESVAAAEDVLMGMRHHYKYNGAHKYDGTMQYDALVLRPVGL
jgi:hypothetical protein